MNGDQWEAVANLALVILILCIFGYVLKRIFPPKPPNDG